MAGVPLGGKPVNLIQLTAELNAVGIEVPSGLGADDNVYTYDFAGHPADLPDGSAAVVDAHVALPDAAILQRATDAATLLNSAAVRDTQLHRDAFARLIQVQPLTIPLEQDATLADIVPL